MRAELDAHIMKPMDPFQLAERVRCHLLQAGDRRHDAVPDHERTVAHDERHALDNRVSVLSRPQHDAGDRRVVAVKPLVREPVVGREVLAGVVKEPAPPARQ